MRKQAFAQAFEEEKDFRKGIFFVALECFGKKKKIYIYIYTCFSRSSQCWTQFWQDWRKQIKIWQFKVIFESPHTFTAAISQPPNTVESCLFQGRHHHQGQVPTRQRHQHLDLLGGSNIIKLSNRCQLSIFDIH